MGSFLPSGRPITRRTLGTDHWNVRCAAAQMDPSRDRWPVPPARWAETVPDDEDTAADTIAPLRAKPPAATATARAPPGSSPAPHKLVGIGPGPRPFAAPAPAAAAAATGGAPRWSGLTHRFDDSDDEGDEPEDPLAKEAPPLRIDDNDGRPLGPPSMATIMGAPGMADPFQWRPPRNLCVVERMAYRNVSVN